MSDLVAFLEARLAEDEAVARASWYEGQRWVPEEEAVVAADRELDPLLFLDRKRDAEHAARHDPARVLAGVAAKRRVLERLADDDAVYGEIVAVEQPLDAEDMTRGALWARDLLLRALASEWAGAEGWDEGWVL